MAMERDIYTGCYGAEAKASEITNWVLRHVKKNIERQANGQPRATLSIMGAPGLGKTSIVKALEKVTVPFGDKEEFVKVVDVPLAQIEEMGDILGFPVEEIEMKAADGTCHWVKAVDAIIRNGIEKGESLTGGKRTTYAPPSWAPTEECPGVILFDDGNRASQRIMRGIMQLVQDYKTIAWAIPKGWTIVFTGNPDNRYNQVTSMDTAQLTRMKFITMKVDAKEWAVWAEDHGVDKRGISFVLRYPEMMIGKERTNPRSLTEFFYSLKDFDNLMDAGQYREMLVEARASLDDETVETLCTFLTRDIELVIEPEDILADADKAIEKVKGLMVGDNPRVDIVSVTMDRLIAYFMSEGYVYKDAHFAPFEKWLLCDAIPADIRYGAMDILHKSKWKYAAKFLKGKELLKMVLDLQSKR